MELLSVIVALETLKNQNSHVTIYSDSKYVVEAIEKKWLDGWVRTNFKKKKNVDLWLRFLEIYKKHHVKFVWIKGHANNPENEVCDKLAVAASQMQILLVDEGYEEMKKEEELF
jgi:ribonuclease HI